jgi:N-acetylmuramoyl-L-alanine amidase
MGTGRRYDRVLGKRIKLTAFVIGVVALFFILQYDFSKVNMWKSWSLPLTGKIILLDAGHGGPDGGAGDKNGLEKDIALSVTLKVKDYLQEQGALVILTREKDVDLADDGTKGYSRRKVQDLKKRLAMINESQADFFVSLHLNSIPSSKWHGAQTFYGSHFKENKEAAKFIQAELRRNLENTDREAKPLNQVYILKNSKKPGVLVEIGFLSNPVEKANLKNEKYQEKIAASIYMGILRYYTNEEELKDAY